MASEVGVDDRGGLQTRAVGASDRTIGDLAERQHGVVARRQLAPTARQVARRVGAEWLRPVHRGVYAVGHGQLTRKGRWAAAVLAGGPEAALSHRSAGILWALLRPSPSLPEVTVPRKGLRRPGIRLHSADLRADEVTTGDGTPVTTVARTVLDLATVLDRQRLERALAEAEHRRYADSPGLAELLERHRGRRGTERLRTILESGHATRGITRSALEDRFLRFLDGRGLARPELNAPLRLGGGWIEVDCSWRAERVIVELDGRAAHLRERRFESDRIRDRRLGALRWETVRVTAWQLDRDAGGLEADLLRLGIGGGDRGRTSG